jgi:hypothetical protein
MIKSISVESMEQICTVLINNYIKEKPPKFDGYIQYGCVIISEIGLSKP